MTSDTIILAVPRDLRFAESIEKFIGVLSTFVDTPRVDRLLFDLKVALNEAFVNIVRHASNDSERLVEIVFQVESQRLTTRIKDSGKGIPVQDCYPPYPDTLNGARRVLSRNLDGEIIATVKDRHSLNLDFKKNEIENESRENLLEMSTAYGMGLSLIAKMSDSVQFIFDEQQGNQLEFVIRY